MGRIKGQANIGTYLKHVNEVGIRTSKIEPGRFYAYNYLFNRDVDFDILKFYDVFPLVFVYELKEQNYFALNFHHMPVQSRLIWLARAKTYAGLLLENDRRVSTLANYRVLKAMFKKSTYGIRQYKKIRVRNLRRIEYDELLEMLEFFANTYFAASVTSVFNKYKLFIPKS